MNGAARRILVVGGNGFIGSAVCKAALARGIKVVSVSSSGEPYRTAKGHSPAWTAEVDWQKGNAVEPASFSHIFPHVEGVVHTLGILIEGGEYKQALRGGNMPQLAGNFLRSISMELFGSRNPLEKTAGGSYEAMNRDTAVNVCEAFMASTASGEGSRPFVYISAEDIFRPVISSRYIETKREAEQKISDLMSDRPDYRAVFMRPSLVYHAHHRPLTTPAAVLLDLSATIHAKVPQGLPTPSSILRSLGTFSREDVAGPSGMATSWLDSVANALVIPPIHVDHVAEAVCVALDPLRDVHGVVDVRRMRELIGWCRKGESSM